MRRFTLPAALAVLIACPAAGQAVSEWRAALGIPVVVVETPGGDLEHVALVVPPECHLPERVLGFPSAVSALRGGRLWSVSVPQLLAVVAFDQILPALEERGCAALVALGPVPARELRGRLASLDGVALHPLPRPICAVADGAEDVVRGSPERVELRLAARGPVAARPELLSALAAWLPLRLAASFPGLRAEAELGEGCPRLLLVAPTADEPRPVLQRLREKLSGLALTPAADEEIGEVGALLQRRASRWAADGIGVAREIAERAAFSIPAASVLTPPLVDGAVLAEAARAVLVGHPGAATIVERESRPAPPRGQTLDNGLTVVWRWVPGDVAAVAIALGGVGPEAGAAAAQAVATAAANAGWPSSVVDLLGVEVVAAAVPPGDVAAFMERAAGALLAFTPLPSEGPDADAAAVLGLASAPRAESTVVAMDLPLAVDDAPEIVTKFFSGLPSGAVHGATPPAEAALTWSQAAGPARLAALVELPANAAGVVAGEVLSGRLRGAGVTTRWLAAPGRPVLLLSARGPADVPALDAASAAAWRTVRGKVGEDELREAERGLVGRLYGDMLRAEARRAGADFVPFLPAPEALLATDATAVNAAIEALPSWANLRRLARGPAPEAAQSPEPAVRKSPS